MSAGRTASPRSFWNAAGPATAPESPRKTFSIYVYGLLHSPDYRTRFAADLKKMLPRLPLLEKPADFWTFSEAGRALAHLHLNYETQAPRSRT